MIWIFAGLLCTQVLQFVLYKLLQKQVGRCQNAIKTSIEWMKSMEAEQLLQDNLQDRQTARIDRLVK